MSSHGEWTITNEEEEEEEQEEEQEQGGLSWRRSCTPTLLLTIPTPINEELLSELKLWGDERPTLLPFTIDRDMSILHTLDGEWAPQSCKEKGGAVMRGRSMWGGFSLWGLLASYLFSTEVLLLSRGWSGTLCAFVRGSHFTHTCYVDFGFNMDRWEPLVTFHVSHNSIPTTKACFYESVRLGLWNWRLPARDTIFSARQYLHGLLKLDVDDECYCNYLASISGAWVSEKKFCDVTGDFRVSAKAMQIEMRINLLTDYVKRHYEDFFSLEVRFIAIVKWFSYSEGQVIT